MQDETRRAIEAEALLAGERRLLEMVASGCALPVVLDALCSIVESSADGCRCSVLLIDSSGTKVQLGAAPSLPSSFNDSIHGRPVDCESGPCGMAAFLKTQVIASDIASDARWDAHGWRTLAMAHGLRSCWSTPILSLADKVLGTFAIYQHEPGSPTPRQQRLIGQLTHIASIAIERAHNEAALRRSEAFLAEAQRLSSTGSFSWHVATDEIVWSEQTYRIYEIDPAVPVTFELVGTRIHPDEIGWFQDLLDRARREGDDLEFEHRLQMPDGSVKYLHVVAHGSRGQDGQMEYIGAVQDVTQRRLAEDARGRAQAELAVLRERHASLGRREREVMELVVSGLLNKQIGARLGISEITVKTHRGKVMRKMKAGSLAELVRMAARLDLPRPLSIDTFV